MKYWYVLQHRRTFKTRCEKPDTKGHILHNSIYMKYPEYVDPESESRAVVAKGWRKGGMVSDCLMATVFFRGDENFLEYDDGCTTL